MRSYRFEPEELALVFAVKGNVEDLIFFQCGHVLGSRRLAARQSILLM